MGQKKLVRFEAIKGFPNVLQNPEGMKGNWGNYFKNDHPITLELACGKGEYSVGLGREHKNRNFIGVDVKGNRIYIGAKIALAEKLDNVYFLRAQIQQITHYFNKNEVAEIWIIFPDPFLRDSKAKNRLTHARFLKEYQQVLKDGGIIHLKTDSKELYDFTLESIQEQDCIIHENIIDIYGKGKVMGALAIQTFYEKMHLADGRTIYYIRFSLPDKPVFIPEKKKNEHAEHE
jgi:tRNA (guanine-N7-)-methyltransferase